MILCNCFGISDTTTDPKKLEKIGTDCGKCLTCPVVRECVRNRLKDSSKCTDKCNMIKREDNMTDTENKVLAFDPSKRKKKEKKEKEDHELTDAERTVKENAEKKRRLKRDAAKRNERILRENDKKK